MPPKPKTGTGSGPLFSLSNRRDPSKVKNASIPELISELRDSFLSSDFDRVEATLMAREERLKAEIEENKREIGSLKEKINLEKLERINAERKLMTVMKGNCDGERLVTVKNENGFDGGKVLKTQLGCEKSKLLGDDEKVVKSKNGNGFGSGDRGKVVRTQVGCEKSKLLGDDEKVAKSKNGHGFGSDDRGKVVQTQVGCEKNKLLGAGGGGVLSGVKYEKVVLLGENKRGENEKIRVVGFNGSGGSAPMKRNEVGVGASGGKLGVGAVINVEDSDGEMYKSRITSNRKVTNPCTITDNEHKSSSEADQKNVPTGLTEPYGIPKRKFAPSRELGANINVFDDSDIDTSSCSSSSSSSDSDLDMDNLPLSTNKRMRSDASSLGLNS